MCSGIEYSDTLLLWRDSAVELPVLLRGGEISWVRWGERHGVVSAFFQGPCARLESIQACKWKRLSPTPVKIPMQRYMERNAKGAPYWVKAPVGSVLQGLLAEADGEHRVYVVTVDSPAEYRHVQPRWPRVIRLEHEVPPDV